jgi:biotin synthase-like enzyme
MAGNMPHSETLWEICRQIAERINKVRPISTFDSYLNIGAPSKDTTQYLRTAKDEMGFRQIAFNLEVVGEERFKEVCPGKARTIGYANYVQALEQAVSIFGFGNVRSNFVLGAQTTEELIEGVRELAKKGIVADYSVFVPKQGTPWESKQSPDMQEIVRFTKVLADIYRQYNFKGIYCSLSSRSNILNEVLENQ